MSEKQDGTLAERLIHWHAHSGLSYTIEDYHIVHKPIPFLKNNYTIEFESNHCNPDIPTSFVFCSYTMSRSWKDYELLIRVYIPPRMVTKSFHAYERLSQSSTHIYDPELADPSVTFQLVSVQKYINYKCIIAFEQSGKVRAQSGEYNSRSVLSGNRLWGGEPNSRDAWSDIMKNVLRYNLIGRPD